LLVTNTAIGTVEPEEVIDVGIQVAGQGAIIDYRVNIGQTIIASLDASSLFLLAEDLKR
jgi:hypothetical protein